MSNTTQRDLWSKGAALMLERITHTAGAVGDRFPNWAAGSTGQWTTTADGDWTGGAWPPADIERLARDGVVRAGAAEAAAAEVFA